MRISEVEGQLVSTYIDWSDFIYNPRGIRRGSIITWTGQVPRMLDHPVKVSNVTALVEEGQYTFQIKKDDSIIQLYYAYDKEGVELQAARLAYYSATVDSMVMNKIIKIHEYDIGLAGLIEANPIYADQDEGLLIEPAEDGEEEIELPSFVDAPVSWLRIDYDPGHSRGVLHHDCHMHISSFPYSRLVVAGVPNPRQFIEFVMSLCYPEVYEQHRLDSNGQYVNENHLMTVNSECVPLREHKVFLQIAHIRIPIISEGRGR